MVRMIKEKEAKKAFQDPKPLRRLRKCGCLHLY